MEKKYGECAKHPNNSMIDCIECAMDKIEPTIDLSKVMKNGFKVFCECQKPDCKHCKGTPIKLDFNKPNKGFFNENYNEEIIFHSESCPNCNTESFDYKEPDWDEMWKNIRDRLDYPLVYFIEHKENKEWIHRTEKRTTKEPLCAMKFEGKNGKAMANLFLFLNQDAGTLKDFIVTEHLFTDDSI